MNSITRLLQKQLTASGEEDALEILDLVPLPRSTDRMLRFKNLQEVLDEFDSSDETICTYVIHVKRKISDAPTSDTGSEKKAAPSSSPVRSEEIYRGDGTLNADYLMKNAHVLFAAGEYASARQIFQSLRKAGTHTSEAMLGLARCHEAEGRTEEALKAYEESLLYHPQLETYQRYAALLIRLKRDQHGAEVIERALLIRDVPEKTRFELHKAAGNCWLRSGMPVKAEQHYSKALSIRPHSDPIATNLGALHLQTGRHALAIDSFTKALHLNPNNVQALIGIATAELSQGKKTEAYESFSRALSMDLNQPKAIFQFVKLAYELKRYDRAAEVLRQYIEVSPFNANLLYSLAGLEFHLGRWDAASRVIDQILQIHPNHEEAKKLQERIRLRPQG